MALNGDWDFEAQKSASIVLHTAPGVNKGILKRPSHVSDEKDKRGSTEERAKQNTVHELEVQNEDL